jgi:hypothetical protein
MSLINCPECGNPVSSSTQQCIHCGCTYTVCPECKKVYIGNLDKCTNCGYEIKKTINKSFFQQSQYAKNAREFSSNNVYESWQRRSATDNTVIKLIKLSCIILTILALLLILIAIVVIWTWDETNIDSLLNLSSVITNSNNLIIAACVIGGLLPICFNFEQLYSEVMLGNWLRKNNYDIKPYVKKIYSTLELNDLNNIETDKKITSAGYLSEVPTDRNIIIAKYIVLCAISIFAIVCIGIFLTQNLEEWLNVKIYSEKFVFQYKTGIVAAIVIVLYYITNMIFNTCYNKRVNNWVSSLK